MNCYIYIYFKITIKILMLILILIRDTMLPKTYKISYIIITKYINCHLVLIIIWIAKINTIRINWILKLLFYILFIMYKLIFKYQIFYKNVSLLKIIKIAKQ